MIQLVKYKNNKIYNKETSKYMSLKEIEELIKTNQDIKILNYLNGNDVTAAVCCSILQKIHLCSNENKGLEILKQLIRGVI